MQMRFEFRLLVAGLALLGCESVLGISEPQPRAEASGGLPNGGSSGRGSAGDGDDGGQSGEAGSATSEQAGSAGAAGAALIGPAGGQGGAGGEAIGGSGGAPLCNEDEKYCDGNTPVTCVDGAWESGTLCQAFCSGGECRNPPSCDGSPTCGSSVSCCRAHEVPGGTFRRDFDNVDFTDANYEASVSTFLLDAFEVTVSRFRKFVDVYPNVGIEPGDGKAPHIAEDEGWQESFPLPSTVEELKANLACDGATWTDVAGEGVPDHPINCVDFYVAYAFCIWDGGRLPTEAEWNYAAAGGDEQRVYPWSSPAGDTSIDATRAYYEQLEGPPAPVGSKPMGNGLWGHADLAGNVYEWNLDAYLDPYPSTDCDDCLQATDTGSRSVRGGSFNSYDFDLMVAMRMNIPQELLLDYTGFRCARDVQVIAEE